MAAHIPIKESRGSRAGQRYHTADGTKIPNQGEKVIRGYTNEGKSVTVKYQIADVTKPLCSVGKICDNSNVVIFTDSGGLIMNKATGVATPFTRENGVYMLRTWVRTPKEKVAPKDFPRQG